MYKPCLLCNKKKPHYHKGCNEDGAMRYLVTPQKKRGKQDEKK